MDKGKIRKHKASRATRSISLVVFETFLPPCHSAWASLFRQSDALLVDGYIADGQLSTNTWLSFVPKHQKKFSAKSS